jgi:hypothetical protein
MGSYCCSKDNENPAVKNGFFSDFFTGEREQGKYRRNFWILPAEREEPWAMSKDLYKAIRRSMIL